ncbi:MAG: DsbA family protein [Bacteroidetes bacterium]|nr:DsbA family protein [Bacteroidota bacterium]
MAVLKEVPLATQGQTPEQGITLYYVYDALCGWCYGFSPVIRQVEERFVGPDLKLEVISGGMIGEDRAQPIGHMSDYILQTLPRLEAMTGVSFSEAYKGVLRDGSRIYASLWPSRALTAWKQLYPERQREFATALQKSIFVDAAPTDNPELYPQIATALGADADKFSEILHSESNHYSTQVEFQFTQELGISGFPALVGLKAGKFYLLARGYTPYEQLAETMSSYLSE